METIQKIADTKICCGCGVCAVSCKSQAINMIKDAEGFLYPKVDSNQCTKCAKCTKVCPIINIDKIKIDTHNISVFAGYINNSEELLSCTSGGAATSISRKIISAGGVVYGVCYVNNFRDAKFTKAETLEELEAFKGSKYIQAEIGNIYWDISESLDTGKPVLFIGLPCEVGAVKSYLKKGYANLLTIELICYGPTSPAVSAEYLKAIEEKYMSKVANFSVRYKKGKWTPPYLHTVFENGKKLTEVFYDTEYGHAFSIFTRPSCYTCQYKGDKRTADLTIGDYWGCSKNDKFWNQKGVSVIFVHTEKGKYLLSDLTNFVLFPSSYEHAAAKNTNIWNQRTVSRNRALFSKIFQEKGLQDACKETKSRKSILRMVSKMIPSFMKPITQNIYHKLKL